MGSVVGLGGGLAAVALNRALRAVSGLLQPCWSHGWAFLLPAGGAALSIFFLIHLVKDTGGHGVPEVIYSISKRGGLLRFRSSYSRLVACLLTIASGGSAGPESPVVISGASIGSNIASAFRLKDRQRIVLVGCGASSAIASIFNAPVAGIVFSLEVILGEWSPINLIPIAVASAVGTEVSRLLQGNQIPFEGHLYPVTGLDLFACIGLAVFTSLASVALIKSLRCIRKESERLVPAAWLRAGLGGMAVGIAGFYLPAVLGEGYDTIRTVIGEEYTTGLLIAGAIAGAKILATAVTIGTGGMGGLFAPALVIGSFTGLFYRRLLAALFPSVPWAGQSYFALLGMAGLISSVLQAPMTGIFLITEITGSYQALVSLVLVSVLSMSLSHLSEPFSVYHQELVARGELLRPRTDRRVLSELNVLELLDQNYCTVPPEMPLGDFVERVRQWTCKYFVVEDSRTGEYIGLVNLDNIRAYLFNRQFYHSLLVEELMDPDVPTVSLEYDLADVLDLFEQARTETLPVVQDRRFLGLISKAIILDHYRKELMVQEEW